jgi:hypothetical protein
MELLIEIAYGCGVRPSRQVLSHADDPLDMASETLFGAEVEGFGEEAAGVVDLIFFRVRGSEVHQCVATAGDR